MAVIDFTPNNITTIVYQLDDDTRLFTQESDRTKRGDKLPTQRHACVYLLRRRPSGGYTWDMSTWKTITLSLHSWRNRYAVSDLASEALVNHFGLENVPVRLFADEKRVVSRDWLL